MELMNWVYTFVGALLIATITRYPDIVIVIKREEQRTEEEKKRVTYGLFREVIADLAFVPIAVTLMMLLVPALRPPIETFASQKILDFLSKFLELPRYTRYAILGFASYGFPFVAIKEWIKKRLVVVAAEKLARHFPKLFEQKKNELELEEYKKKESKEETPSAKKALEPPAPSMQSQQREQQPKTKKAPKPSNNP